MNLEVLREQIEKGMPLAAQLAGQIGKDARPIALAALASPSGPSREAAVYCLEEIGDPADLPAVAARVTDPDRGVAAAATTAVRSMHLKAPAQGAAVLGAFDATPDPDLKAELALALGERSDVPLDVLRKRAKDEKRAPVKKAIEAALAKRGSEREVRTLVDELRRAKGQAKKEAIERSVYVDRAALLPALARLLDDPEELVFISPARSPDVRYERACDLAAWAIGEITSTTFSFSERGFYGLGKAEIDEVKARVREVLGEKR
jgi:HEAT repeat protein